MALEDFTLQTPGAGQVAVQVKFAAVNPIDWKLRNGAMKIVTGRSFPRAMGMDFSGTVLSVGPGVTRLKAGDAVFGMARLKQGGAFAEAVITNEGFLARKPDEVSFENAACLATPGVTAWNALVDKGRLQPGQHVFINGCMGGVGDAAVQIAKLLGATVSGSCSAASIASARAAGLENVYDYKTTDYAQVNERFDIVFDTAATMSAALAYSLLRRNGVFLDINPLPGKFIRALFDRRLKPIVCNARPDILAEIAAAAANGKLVLPIGEIVPLAQAVQLISKLEDGLRIGGKGLISIG
jgi:NADPH:quinone reductase-like Zn-dependent oxidoreductase